MRTRTVIEGSLHDKCLLNIDEGMFFTGMGRRTFRSFADEIGATRRRGRRVFFHKPTIEQALMNEKNPHDIEGGGLQWEEQLNDPMGERPNRSGSMEKNILSTATRSRNSLKR